MTAVNAIAIHPLVFIGRWTRALGPQAIERAASCGFDSIIIPLREPGEVDPSAIARCCAAAGIQPIAAINHSPATDPASTDAATTARGEALLLLAVSLARDLGAAQLGGLPHAAWGKAPAPVSAAGRANAVAVLGRVARAAAAAELRLTLEAVNRFENALVNTAEQGFALIDEVGEPNLLLHLDTHHMQMEEADPVKAVACAAARLGYLEFSESHRGTLGTGTVDIAAVMRAAVAAGYAGPIGFEAFSSAILDPVLAAHLCIWRATYSDADAVARSAQVLLRRELATVRAARSKA